MKTTTHTLLSAAQSTGLRALSLCHWVVNVEAAVQRSVRQAYRGSAAAPCRGISPTSPGPWLAIKLLSVSPAALGPPSEVRRAPLHIVLNSRSGFVSTWGISCRGKDF